MTPLLLASEGGYQPFHLGSSDKFVLLFSGVTALLAIAVGFFLAKGVLAADQGTPKMIAIAKASQEGALAYLKRQFRTIVLILIPLAAVVFLTSVKVVKPDGSVALSFVQSGLFRTLAFLAGCTMSGLTGFIGMSLATQGNVRTAAAAKTGSLPAALQVAFQTGGVAGLFTVGLGLFGATIIITIFQNTSSAILVGFGFGGSLLALFLRVGGGIFTKAADVGADLVGKVEAGIPEDDPRNPATIADNVGDNVGDCAGMAADLVVGLVLAQVVSRLTEYFTGTEYSPVREIAEAARTGPATTVLSGISSGLESSVYAVIAIAIALGVSIALGGGNLQFSLYLVALCGMGMLATTGVVVSEDTFGPVADNAAGIAEMSGEFHGPPERIMVSLDAVGNTTKAVTKGFAIGSAVIAAVALFASYIETIGSELGLKDAAGRILEGTPLFRDVHTQINVADPKVFIGLLIGGSVPFLFSALAIRAVGRTAAVVVQEVRRQFADGKIMEGTKRPDYGPVIDICTAASLRELATPALLAVLAPVIIGFGINYLALGAFLAAVILTGQLMANFLSNAGGAWDNAKKYIEDGHEGGKGSDAHKAAVIGDTVGDPFKDTAGPALNPLIKVMNLVSLLTLPAIINLKDNDPARFSIAGVALVVLIGAVAFSKRKGEAMDSGTPAAAEAARAEANV